MDQHYLKEMAGPGGVASVSARWVFTSELTLKSAAHLGAGREGDQVDMPVIRDSEGNPLLTGSSVAGALRSYLYDLLFGYRAAEPDAVAGKGQHLAALLFGPKTTQQSASGSLLEDDGHQSRVITFDTVACLPGSGIEIRDGVKIDGKTGSAERNKKFDLELLPAGTTFPLRVDLMVFTEYSDPKEQKELEERLVGTLAAALDGFTEGHIPLGARDSRGLGRCVATGWRSRRFDLASRAGWLEWLGSDHTCPVKDNTTYSSASESAQKMVEAAGLHVEPVSEDKRKSIEFDLELTCEGALMVASPNADPFGVDTAHIRSGEKPILPGTSLAGVLRLQALRIAKWIAGKERASDAQEFVGKLFGPALDGTTGKLSPNASRVRVQEAVLEQCVDLQQTRIQIDRFTSGVVQGALVEEQPIFGSRVRLRLELRVPESENEMMMRAQAGLMALVIKDLVTGEIPVGGGSAIGRGVLYGSASVKGLGSQAIDISYRREDTNGDSRTGAGLTVYGNNACLLDDAITALHECL